jgi:Rieske 2Fe-2S family protein
MTHPASPLLSHCPPGLPRAAYSDDGWFARERAAIWRREWVHVGRAADLPPGTMRGIEVAGAPVLLTRTAAGSLRAWHNACRHRGAALCSGERAMGRLVACPYHAWAYAAEDGRLVATGPAVPTRDFRREDHGLVPVALTEWAGSLFVSLAAEPPPFAPDLPAALDNWPMAGLRTGHRLVRDVACNWKVFWENFNECLHCPGIHPGLTDMVPVYRRGIMAANEAPDWRPGQPAPPALKPGARSWTPDGAPCGPEFPDLTEAERAAGYTFVTVYPSAFFVAHVDYVRCVTVTPLSPVATRLTAEWLFAPATLAQPGFDAARVAGFAAQVLEEDAAACEMNQRGLASPAFDRATLMPQEFDIHRFHRWIAARLEDSR